MRSLTLVFFLALSALSVRSAEAQSYVELLDEARLFAEPNHYADIVATVPEEAVGELLKCSTSWCEVRFGSEVGYVKQRNLMATDRRPPAPPPPPPAPTPPPTLALETVPAPTTTSLPAPATEPLYEAEPISLPPPTPVLQQPVAPTPAPTVYSQPAAQPPARSSSRSASLKNPAAGTLLSAILPGTGHLYAGEPGAGMALLLTSISAPAVGYLLSDRTADLTCVPTPADPQASCSDTTNYGPLFVGIGIAATAWVAGLIDAGAAARRANERHHAARVRVDPVARPNYAGLALRVSL